MSRLPPDFGPAGPPEAFHARPWRELVTELHAPADRAFRLLAERLPLASGVLWLPDAGTEGFQAAALWRAGETWDGEERRPAAGAPRLRRALEGARADPFAFEGALWAPLKAFDAAVGALELRPKAGASLDGAGSLAREAARALALSVWRAAAKVRDRRRELHLRTLSELGVLIHESLQPGRLIEGAARRLVRNLGLDRVKVYLWDDKKRAFRGRVSCTVTGGARENPKETFDPDAEKGGEAPRVRHAVPLAAGGDTVGWMAVDNLLSQQEIAMDEVHLLEAVAAQLALAVKNALKFEGVETLATTDALTGLLLGRVFKERLEQEFRRAERSRHAFAVCMMDVDKFKTINDTHGHPVGDRVLAGVAKRLKAVSRRMDVVARYAGDEFVVLLPQTTPERAVTFAARVNESVRRLAVPGAGGPVKPTVSIGVAVWPDHGATPEELIRAADEALYRTKRAGRDGATLYSLEPA